MEKVAAKPGRMRGAAATFSGIAGYVVISGRPTANASASPTDVSPLPAAPAAPVG